MPLQIRRGNTAEVNSITPLIGELIYNTQTGRVLVGDGATAGGILVAGVSVNDTKDAAASSLLAGTHKNISFSYDSVTKALSATVDILTHETIVSDAIVTGKIFNTASTVVIDVDTATINGTLLGNVTGNVTGNIKGSVFADDSTLLVDAIDGVLRGTLIGNAATATVSSTLDITNTNGLTTVYYPTFVEDRTNGQIVRADVDLTYRTDTNTLTAQAFAGNLTGNTVGYHTGDVKGSVFADDSTMLVDATNGRFFGDLTGNVSGNIETSLISSATSTTIVVDTPVNFQTAVTVEGDSNFYSESTFITNETNLRTIALDQFHSDSTSASFLNLRRARGNNLSPTNVLDGDTAGLILSSAKVTNGYDTIAGIFTKIQGTPTSSTAPGSFEFWTRSSTTNTFAPRLRIRNDGQLFQNINDFSTAPFYRLAQIHNNLDSRDFRLTKARESAGVLNAVQADDVLAKFNFEGYDGSDYVPSSQIRAVVETGATVTTGTVPGRLDFLVANNAGTLIEKMLIGAVSTLINGQLIVASSTVNSLPLYLQNNTSSATDGARLGMRRSRGTYTAPTAVQNGDVLYRLGWGGYDGSAYRDSAFITGTVTGAVSSGVIPTKLSILTENSSGTKTLALEITDTQVVKIDTIASLTGESTNFSNAVRLVVYADNAARDAAITSPTAGMMVFNTTGTKFQGYTGAAWVDLN